MFLYKFYDKFYSSFISFTFFYIFFTRDLPRGPHWGRYRGQRMLRWPRRWQPCRKQPSRTCNVKPSRLHNACPVSMFRHGCHHQAPGTTHGTTLPDPPARPQCICENRCKPTSAPACITGGASLRLSKAGASAPQGGPPEGSQRKNERRHASNRGCCIFLLGNRQRGK